MDANHRVDQSVTLKIRALRGIFRAALATAVLAGCAGSQQATADSAGDTVSDYQQEILGDDLVTFGELEGAVSQYVACIEGDTSLRVEYVFDEQARAFSFLFTDLAGGDASQIVEQPEAVACNEEYKFWVERFWADQEGPSPEDDAAFYAAIAECMRVKGFDVEASDPATLDYWIGQEPEEYDDCFRTVQFSPEG